MKAILTIAAGDGFHEIAALTHPLISAYARAIGADFISLNSPAARPHFAKFRISEFLGIYQRVLFIDSDIIVTDNCPDLFALVPEDRFGAWFPNPMMPGRFAENIRHVQTALGHINWVSGYFNSGVMVVSRVHRAIFENPQDYSDMFFEQTLLNYRVKAGRYATFDLGYRWNHTGVLFSDRRLCSHFIHYAGSGHIRGMSRVEQIRTDLRALGKL